MKVILTAGVRVAGEHKDIGDILEVSDAMGAMLIGSNKAEKYTAPVAVPAVEAPAKVEAPAVVEEPAVEKKTKRRK